MKKTKIRNFAIIAHIDHGKSTLADRILEITNTINKRELNAQHLDSMELEKEKGITIKLNAVQIKHEDFVFHLIDTPGHVDFTYEVSRSLAACEGAILLVDATQGIEAQTLSNVYLALENDLEIIPVINKIDLPSADPERIKNEIEEQIGISTENAIEISAKTGKNIDLVIKEIIDKIPYPDQSDDSKPLKALVFDSYFDSYRGVILLVRIFEGQVKKGDKIKFMSNGKEFEVVQLGVRNPSELEKKHLESGEVGFLAASIRNSKDVMIGDTVTLVNNPTKKMHPGYKKINPVVYTGFYPIDGKDYIPLREALEKIVLSDSSLVFEQETSKALGHGFRIGFLGLLHMEIIKERLEREFNLSLITTFPSVQFAITKTDDAREIIANPTLFPDVTKIAKIEEPYIKGIISIPSNYVGACMELCQTKRGKYINLDILDSTRHVLTYELPLVEIIFDFFDKLKSLTKGYSTFDYEMLGYRETDLVKVDILLNGDKVDAFSFISHREKAYEKSKILTEKLKSAIPRHNFEIPVQAVINKKVIARETIKAFRKDVTAKLYGGDRTRRDKLLKKQKAGKKKARMFGSVEVPQEAFLSVLKSSDK